MRKIKESSPGGESREWGESAGGGGEDKANRWRETRTVTQTIPACMRSAASTLASCTVPARL
jgi:hypothetical protein